MATPLIFETLLSYSILMFFSPQIIPHGKSKITYSTFRDNGGQNDHIDPDILLCPAHYCFQKNIVPILTQIICSTFICQPTAVTL